MVSREFPGMAREYYGFLLVTNIMPPLSHLLPRRRLQRYPCHAICEGDTHEVPRFGTKYALAI